MLAIQPPQEVAVRHLTRHAGSFTSKLLCQGFPSMTNPLGRCAQGLLSCSFRQYQQAQNQSQLAALALPATGIRQVLQCVIQRMYGFQVSFVHSYRRQGQCCLVHLRVFLVFLIFLYSTKKALLFLFSSPFGG